MPELAFIFQILSDLLSVLTDCMLTLILYKVLICRQSFKIVYTEGLDGGHIDCH